MIIASLICVVVAAITLVVGYLNQDSSILFVCIGAGLLGLLFLLMAMFQARTRPKPLRSATVSGDEAAGPATWKGAGWGGGDAPKGNVLTRPVAAPPETVPPTTSADAPGTEPPVDDDVFKPPSALPPPSAPASASAPCAEVDDAAAR